jgi:membrane peptidoglycan carboxypeptidase
VIPHGLSLDPAGTRLRLLGLDQPFVASIHLPHDRVVSRDLSDANPFFRPLDAIAPALVYAVVTNEDGGFFHHRGFNLEAMRGAIIENLRAGAFRRGAGTITMQLARNLYLGHERTLSRKFREVVLAWTLEHLSGVSKQRLLEIYFNIIEWGPDVHGAGEAAHYYFDRDPARLSVDEALFLATVVPAPTKWRYRFDAAGELRPFERAQMHFIGRAMIAKGWLAPEGLPAAETLRVELRGAAREALEGAAPGAGEASAARPRADSRE